MNRIVLIGNGFDLAHGMKTSYNDFLNHLWKEILNKYYPRGIAYSSNDFVELSGWVGTWEDVDDIKSFEAFVYRHFKSIHFKNRFFEKIVKRQYIDSWVDIEKEYYRALIKSYNRGPSLPFDEKESDIDTLNIDFTQIKNSLNDYLSEIEEKFNDDYRRGELTYLSRIKKEIGLKIYHSFKLKDFSETSINQKVDEKYESITSDVEALKEEQISHDEISDHNLAVIKRLDSEKSKSSLRKLMVENENPPLFVDMPTQVLLLNFNYTLLEMMYTDSRDFVRVDYKHPEFTEPNHIHGSVDSLDNNPIIFGYGDELDDKYGALEKLDDNRYLENIKSVKYLDRDNYKRLLEFVNGDQYQVVIMGHSCGNSDRTLLNTLFEHDNCVSIKPYYYQKKDGSDNYSDIVRNITRNFNDKQKLRDRVVNKQYCEPLL